MVMSRVPTENKKPLIWGCCAPSKASATSVAEGMVRELNQKLLRLRMVMPRVPTENKKLLIGVTKVSSENNCNDIIP